MGDACDAVCELRRAFAAVDAIGPALIGAARRRIHVAGCETRGRAEIAAESAAAICRRSTTTHVAADEVGFVRIRADTGARRERGATRSVVVAEARTRARIGRARLTRVCVAVAKRCCATAGVAAAGRASIVDAHCAATASAAAAGVVDTGRAGHAGKARATARAARAVVRARNAHPISATADVARVAGVAADVVALSLDARLLCVALARGGAHGTAAGADQRLAVLVHAKRHRSAVCARRARVVLEQRDPIRGNAAGEREHNQSRP
jgi:hypothetical protein